MKKFILLFFIATSFLTIPSSVSAEIVKGSANENTLKNLLPLFQSEFPSNGPTPTRAAADAFCKKIDPAIAEAIGTIQGNINRNTIKDRCEDWRDKANTLTSATRLDGSMPEKVAADYKNSYTLLLGVLINAQTAIDSYFGGGSTRSQTNQSDPAANAALAAAQAAANKARADFAATGCPATKTAGEKETCDAARTALAAATSAETAAGNTSADVTGTGQQQDAPKGETECSFTNLGSWFTYCIRDGAQWLIKVVLVGLIAAPILGASGAFFDLVLRISIVNFSDMLGLVDATSSTDSTIYATWVLVRNLFNIIILFQLLKIAVEKIIGRSLGKDKGDLKQKLVAIIIFSLLTNFSFFFTKAMIDVSNIATLQFYAGLGASPTDATGSILKGSISIAIVDSLGIGTAKILQTTGAIERGSATGVLTDATTPLIDIGGGKTGTIYDTFTGAIVVFCLLMLAAFILVQGAMIFLTRAVMLVFLIVLSPLMFAGGIMGFVDKWSKSWWNRLTEQLFVAPLYLAMLFITLKVAGNGTEAGLLKSLQGVTGSSNVGFFSEIAIMLIQGVVMAGLFIACVKIAKEYGGEAAKKSSAWGAKLYGATVGGGLGYTGRKTFGRLGTMATTGKSGEWLQKQKLKGGGLGVLAAGALSVGNSVSNSSFDMRKGLGASVKSINSIAGTKLDIGGLGESKSKGFYDDTVADAKKRKEDREKAAKKATEVRGDINETGTEKSARETANAERLATYGKVIAYELDSDGNHIMEEVRDENNNVVIDPITGQPKKQRKVKMKDGKVVYEDSVTTSIIAGTRDTADSLTGAKKQSTINEGILEDAQKANKKKIQVAENEKRAERKYQELLLQTYDEESGKMVGTPLTPEAAKEHWERQSEKYEEARETLNDDIENLKRGNRLGRATLDRTQDAYLAAEKELAEALLKDPELKTRVSKNGDVGVEWNRLAASVKRTKEIRDLVTAADSNPEDAAAQQKAKKILQKELISTNTKIAQSRAAKRDIDVGANKFGILKEKKNEVKPSPTA